MPGISGTCLSWFRSYLSNRRQSFAIAKRISSTKELHHGVPRDCGLGPILFVLYIQPLSNQIKRHSMRVHLLADDIQIETSILPQNVHSAISDVKYWMIENKLQLNDEKTECLLMRPDKCTQNETPLLFHLDTMSYHSLLLHKASDSFLQMTCELTRMCRTYAAKHT